MKVNQKGFTLVEILVVIALLGISVGVTNDILVSLIRASTKTQVINEVEQQANFVSLKIEKELRDTSLVTDASGNTLSFNLRDGTNITYSLSSDTLTRRVNTGTALNLTSKVNPGGVVVSCIGECFSLGGTNPQVVNIKLEFSQAQTGAGSSYAGSAKIDTSVVIKNTY